MRIEIIKDKKENIEIKMDIGKLEDLLTAVKVLSESFITLTNFEKDVKLRLLIDAVMSVTDMKTLKVETIKKTKKGKESKIIKFGDKNER